MAWLFELEIECGSSHEAARISDFFLSRTVQPNGYPELFVCIDEPFQETDGSWWCRVYTGDVGGSNDTQTLTVYANELYRLLSMAPPFRFAIPGIEARDVSYGTILLNSGGTVPGTVLHMDTWVGAGKPDHFERLSDGIHWIPLELG